MRLIYAVLIPYHHGQKRWVNDRQLETLCFQSRGKLSITTIRTSQHLRSRLILHPTVIVGC